MTITRLKVHEISPKPLLIVNGTPMHYHEAIIDQAQPEEPTFGDLLDHRRPVFRPTFPFTLRVGVYLAPCKGRQSLWRFRTYSAESWSREQWTGEPRERFVFETAIDHYPEQPEYEIRSKNARDLMPNWMSDRRCQYQEPGPLYTKIGAPPRIIGCFRPASYVIMFVPKGAPIVDHFGYICSHHKPEFEQFVRENRPPELEEYSFRELKP